MTRHVRLLVALVISALMAGTAPTAQATDLWPGSFKDYEQIESEILAVELAHPEIVDVFSIGQSYEGRQLYAAKVSDNVALEEGEAEVLIDALHHSNEHVTVAQALDLLHTLVDGYGVDTAVTTLVDQRVVWIVFVVNPDGLEFEFTEKGPWNWRKNRQPTPGSTSIGTDLNRNYSAYWHCCSASVRIPASRVYAGPAKFSAPETAAMRDFVASRVINGVQRITIYLSLHAAGRYIAWPRFPPSAGVRAITLDAKLEQQLAQGVRHTPTEVSLMLEPRVARHVVESLSRHIQQMLSSGQQPLVLCAPQIRLAFRRFFETTFADLNVLAYTEVPARVEIQSAAVVPGLE